MNTKLVLFLSCFAAVALTASAVNADPRGGGHGRHFSSMSRGGQTFTRSGATFSGRNWSGRNWSGGNWSGRNWSGRNWSGGNWSGGEWGGGDWGWYPSGGWGISYPLNYRHYFFLDLPLYRYGICYSIFLGLGNAYIDADVDY